MSKYIIDTRVRKRKREILFGYQSVGESLLLPDDDGPLTGDCSPVFIPVTLSSACIIESVLSKCAYCFGLFFCLSLSCFLQRTIS